jgi:hypothetical protein
MTRPTNSNDTDESLTHVDADALTDHELRAVLPDCDVVVVGYDSVYSPADVTTTRVTDPEYDANTVRHSPVPITGVDADDPERGIGFGTDDVHTVTTGARIGTVRFVRYPAPPLDKTRYTVTFRALAGNWTTARDLDDLDPVSLAESTADKHAFDDAERPPADDCRVVDIDVGKPRPRRRATVDVPVTIVDVDTADRDAVVERARERLGSTGGDRPDVAVYRDDLPPVGDHLITRNGVARRDTNLRAAPRYLIEDVDVDAEPV